MSKQSFATVAPAPTPSKPRRVRRLGPGLEVDLSITSKGLLENAKAAFEAANFYLFFIESIGRREEGPIREARDGVRLWRDRVEDTIERWNVAIAGMKAAIAGKPYRIRDNGVIHTFECNCSNSMLLVSLYEAADETLKHIRLLEILLQVDQEAAKLKKHEIRAEVGLVNRELSRLFRAGVARLNDAMQETASDQPLSAVGESLDSTGDEADAIELPDDATIATVEADD